MYRLSPLPRRVLITTDEVIAMGHGSSNPEIRELLAAIQIAEERFISPLLGADFYNDFRMKKNVVVDSLNIDFLSDAINEDNNSEPVVLKIGQIVNALEIVDSAFYIDLWNEHLWKIAAEAVIYIATPTNFSRFEASGEMMNNPKTLGMGDSQGAASVELSTTKWKMDKMMQDRLDPLIASAKAYLCTNIGNFPYYDHSNCKGKDNGISIERKSAWIFGIYDNKDCGCNEQ